MYNELNFKSSIHNIIPTQLSYVEIERMSEPIEVWLNLEAITR
jgi:hypothetical protein